mmetsp:Transcript_10272/g.23420  ORF Transcript_10272/g.23420 Transcript_10272/m.23420 type:complete len:161 (+) Transcript_10272:484-966(+)
MELDATDVERDGADSADLYESLKSQQRHGEDNFTLGRAYFKYDGPSSSEEDDDDSEAASATSGDSMYPSSSLYMSSISESELMLDSRREKRVQTELAVLPSIVLTSAERELSPPNQNTKDCGVFLCLFAAYLSLELPLDFGPDSILNARARIGHAVINGY